MGLDMYLFLEDKETKEKHEFSYYRKFNALQGYFVREHNLENCGVVELDLDEVEKIYSMLNQVRYNPDVAPNVLPIHYGPFFGSYEYDDLYYQDVSRAAKDFYHARYVDYDKYKLCFSSDW